MQHKNKGINQMRIQKKGSTFYKSQILISTSINISYILTQRLYCICLSVLVNRSNESAPITKTVLGISHHLKLKSVRNDYEYRSIKINL